MNHIIALMLLDVAFVIGLNDYQWSVFGVKEFIFYYICVLCLQFILCVIKNKFYFLVCCAVFSVLIHRGFYFSVVGI
jgi:hypothetical protein